MAKSNIQPTYTVEPVKTDDLLFDVRNPRFAGDDVAPDQTKLLGTLWSDFD